jgi:NTE family protein
MMPRPNRNLEEDSHDRGQGKDGICICGRSSLGAVQVGMLRVLLEAGVQPDFVIGTCAGAMNAAYFAAFPNKEGVEKLARL